MIATSAEQCPTMPLSDIEDRLVCTVRGKSGTGIPQQRRLQ
jgi:hypothetical protein